MTDHLDRLTTALADHYTIQEELGVGGMATVYLAEDLKHQPGAQYDVAPDDQSFLMVRRDPGSIPTRINVVTNFFEELKAKVGN